VKGGTLEAKGGTLEVKGGTLEVKGGTLEVKGGTIVDGGQAGAHSCSSSGCRFECLDSLSQPSLRTGG
jgi:hypothetical protein